MASRYKATGCARFFFFLLFFIPLVYFGLKYLDDQGELENWRDKLNLDNDKSTTEVVLDKKDNSEFDVQAVKRQIADLLSKIETQDQIIRDQAVTIEKQRETIESLSQGAPTVLKENPQSTPPETKSKEPSLEDLLKEADKALKKNQG